MSEPWLRDTEGAWIPSPQVQGVHNLFVNDLLIPNTKLWDKERIESFFPSDIANRIIDIPLFDMLDEDKLVWVDSPYGHYSVKSGYKLMLNVIGKGVIASQQEDWHSLWKIFAPPKTKHLLWRVSKGCLPTRLRLQEKHVPCPILCPLCSLEEEDDMPALFSCEVSRQAWQTVGLEAVIMSWFQQGLNVKDTIHVVCANEEKMTAGLFATVVWVL
jgi:hypothetical protein